MNFYGFLKQQCEDYKIGKGCESCPCKILRDKIFGGIHRRICLEEIIYLANKYNVHDNNDDWLCQRRILISPKIAKKLFEKEFNKI